MSLIIPKANPDYDEKIPLVRTWYVGFDERLNCVTRELGTDNTGKVVFKTPDKDNYGFWADSGMSLDDFESRFSITHISQYAFETLWDKTK